MSIQQGEGWRLWAKSKSMRRQALRRTAVNVLVILSLLLTGTWLLGTPAFGDNVEKDKMRAYWYHEAEEARVSRWRCLSEFSLLDDQYWAKVKKCESDREPRFLEALRCTDPLAENCGYVKEPPKAPVPVSCPDEYPVATPTGDCVLKPPKPEQLVSCPAGYLDPQRDIPVLLESTEQSRITPPSDIKWAGLLETVGDILDHKIFTSAEASVEGYLVGSDWLSRREWEKYWKPHVINYLEYKYGLSDLSASEWDKWATWWAKTAGFEKPAGKIIWVLDKVTGVADLAGLYFNGRKVIEKPNPETVGESISSVAGVVAFIGPMVKVGPIAVLAATYEASFNVGKLGEWASEQLFGWTLSDLGYTFSDLRHRESPPYKDPDGIEWYSQCWIARKQAEAKLKLVSCPEGYRPTGSDCVPVPKPQKLVSCPEGYRPAGGDCVPVPRGGRTGRPD